MFIYIILIVSKDHKSNLIKLDTSNLMKMMMAIKMNQISERVKMNKTKGLRDQHLDFPKLTNFAIHFTNKHQNLTFY